MQRGGVPCEPPPERETNASRQATTSLAWMKATSFFWAAEWIAEL
jgi:hypothetical protein